MDQHPETGGPEALPKGSREDPAKRPGVPREQTAGRVDDGGEPEAQPGRDERSSRAELERATPVFGTAQPLRGTSGRLRRYAYELPEHRARHWAVLMAADRVDVLEDRLGDLLEGPLRAVGLHGLADRFRRDPLPVVAGAAAGLLLTVLLRSRR